MRRQAALIIKLMRSTALSLLALPIQHLLCPSGFWARYLSKNQVRAAFFRVSHVSAGSNSIAPIFAFCGFFYAILLFAHRCSPPGFVNRFERTIWPATALGIVSCRQLSVRQTTLTIVALKFGTRGSFTASLYLPNYYSICRPTYPPIVAVATFVGQNANIQDPPHHPPLARFRNNTQRNTKSLEKS
jgi:hypothetical protein